MLPKPMELPLLPSPSASIQPQGNPVKPEDPLEAIIRYAMDAGNPILTRIARAFVHAATAPVAAGSGTNYADPGYELEDIALEGGRLQVRIRDDTRGGLLMSRVKEDFQDAIYFLLKDQHNIEATVTRRGNAVVIAAKPIESKHRETAIMFLELYRLILESQNHHS